MPAYVTGPPDVIHTLVTDDGHFLVTDTGVQLVAPVSFQGAPELVDLSVGGIQMTSAYVGSDLVYLYDPLQIVTMVSGEDEDLETLLIAAGVNPAKPVIVNMASTEILGGVNDVCLTLINLGAYTNITINLNGEWQGKAGADAIRSDQNLIIINDDGGSIEGAVSDVTGGTTSNVSIVIGAEGRILAGGGDGGEGGKGGYGDNVDNFTAFRNGWTSNSAYRTPVGGDTGRLIIYWDTKASNIFDGGSVSMINYKNGGYLYQRGSLALTESGNGWFNIRRGSPVTGNGGEGGTGGVGRGYNQTKSDGAAGGSGVNRGGSGGDGGDGRWWGLDGKDGNIGETGLYYSTTNSNTQALGEPGTDGTKAGFSIVTTGTVIYP